MSCPIFEELKDLCMTQFSSKHRCYKDRIWYLPCLQKHQGSKIILLSTCLWDVTWTSFLCFFMSTSWASWILWIISWQHPSTLILYWQMCAWVFSRIKQFFSLTATKMCLAAVESTQGRTAEAASQLKVEEMHVTTLNKSQQTNQPTC